MNKQRKLEQLTKSYLKKLTNSFIQAFAIGYSCARENKALVQPPIPENDDELTRLAKLMAWEFVIKGYEAGGGKR